MWLIDEKARILRVDVWASPPIAPAIAESEIARFRIKILIFLSKHLMERIKGASFCQIKIILELIQ